jgi:glycosyltransferase involved in cell wall biosynthesis
VAGDAAVYFDPSDTASIQHTLEATLFDQNLLDDLRKRGLERQSKFSWDRCANETLAVYNSLLQ